MTSLLIGGTTIRRNSLAQALGSPIEWLQIATASTGTTTSHDATLRFPDDPIKFSVRLDIQDVRLVVISVDAFATPAASDDPKARSRHLKNAILTTVLPLQASLSALGPWCRIVWIVSSHGVKGNSDVVQSAVEHYSIGAMRALTRELAKTVSTCTIVTDVLDEETEGEQQLAGAVACLANPTSGFYTGQILDLSRQRSHDLGEAHV